jgi:hypothetical protein
VPAAFNRARSNVRKERPYGSADSRCRVLSSLCGDGTNRSRVPRLLRNKRGCWSYGRPGRLQWHSVGWVSELPGPILSMRQGIQ